MKTYNIKRLVDVAEYKVECEVDEFPEAVLALLHRAQEDEEVPHCITFDFPEVDGKWYILLTC